MARLNTPVDCNNVEPRAAFEPFEGTFRAHITDSEMKATKAGNGEYLALKLEVMDGPLKGRTAFDNLNLDNPSEKAMEIAYQTLSAIGHATGVLNISDSEQVHHRPMLVTFAIDGAYTRVKGYASIDDASHPSMAPHAAAPAAPAPAKKPWERTAA